MARKSGHNLALVAGGLATLAIPYLLGSHEFRMGFGAILAACAAYLLLGPAMSIALRQLSRWMSSES